MEAIPEEGASLPAASHAQPEGAVEPRLLGSSVAPLPPELDDVAPEPEPVDEVVVGSEGGGGALPGSTTVGDSGSTGTFV